MATSILISLAITVALFVAGRVLFLQGRKIGEESARIQGRRRIQRDVDSFYDWWNDGPGWQTSEFSKTEVLAEINGMIRAADLI